MQTIDMSDLIAAIIALFTIFLVTIPSLFINEALNGGVLFTIWNLFFGNAKILQMLFILTLIGGIYFSVLSWNRPSNNNNVNKQKRI